MVSYRNLKFKVEKAHFEKIKIKVFGAEFEKNFFAHLCTFIGE